MLSLVIFLFLFPYIVTVFFQGTSVAGESVCETATETAVMAQGSMPKEREQLIAAQKSLEEMRQFVGADSLAFISVDGLYRAMGHERRDPQRPQFTDHCFTGDYPTSLTDMVGESAKQQISLLAEAG